MIRRPAPMPLFGDPDEMPTPPSPIRIRSSLPLDSAWKSIMPGRPGYACRTTLVAASVTASAINAD
jgi:hypothetical protein